MSKIARRVLKTLGAFSIFAGMDSFVLVVYLDSWALKTIFFLVGILSLAMGIFVFAVEDVSG